MPKANITAFAMTMIGLCSVAVLSHAWGAQGSGKLLPSAAREALELSRPSYRAMGYGPDLKGIKLQPLELGFLPQHFAEGHFTGNNLREIAVIVWNNESRWRLVLLQASGSSYKVIYEIGNELEMQGPLSLRLSVEPRNIPFVVKSLGKEFQYQFPTDALRFAAEDNLYIFFWDNGRFDTKSFVPFQ